MTNYRKLSRSELSNRCRQRNLIFHGEKPELIARLVQSDQANRAATIANFDAWLRLTEFEVEASQQTAEARMAHDAEMHHLEIKMREMQEQMATSKANLLEKLDAINIKRLEAHKEIETELVPMIERFKLEDISSATKVKDQQSAQSKSTTTDADVDTHSEKPSSRSQAMTSLEVATGTAAQTIEHQRQDSATMDTQIVGTTKHSSIENKKSIGSPVQQRIGPGTAPKRQGDSMEHPNAKFQRKSYRAGELGWNEGQDELDLTHFIEDDARSKIFWPYVHVVLQDLPTRVEYMAELEINMSSYEPLGVRADRNGYYVCFRNDDDGKENARRCKKAFQGKRLAGKKQFITVHA